MIGVRTLKTGLGATITLIIADSMGLQYATAAAVSNHIKYTKYEEAIHSDGS